MVARRLSQVSENALSDITPNSFNNNTHLLPRFEIKGLLYMYSFVYINHQTTQTN